MEQCKLGLHKTLTHAEKSRVLKVSAEGQAKPQAACCLQINRNWGMPGTSENLALAQGFLKFRHYSREQERATYMCRGKIWPFVISREVSVGILASPVGKNSLRQSKQKLVFFPSVFFHATAYDIEKYVIWNIYFLSGYLSMQMFVVSFTGQKQLWILAV